MRRPLPWYTDTLTDTIFRSWPGPGYVSGDRIVSGAFCHPQRHATRSQLHLKWTRTIYQCLMDRVFKNWMNTGSRNMPKLTIVVLLLTDNILHKNLSDIEFLRNQMQNEWLARWLKWCHLWYEEIISRLRLKTVNQHYYTTHICCWQLL